MDNLTYHYYAGTNRLEYVDDAVGSGAYPGDINDQGAGNYTYDAVGQMITNDDEDEVITWNAYHRPVKREESDGTTVEYFYDSFMRRICKKETNPGAQSTYTYYAYDGDGNLMATYAKKDSSTYEKMSLKDHLVYGSGRLGILARNKKLSTHNSVGSVLTLYAHDDTSRTLGRKMYELTGHTGNVNVVITDRAVAVDDGSGTVYTYLPDVMSVADFYPFGVLQPGRNQAADQYMYLFQGMEADDEMSTTGSMYTTEFRQYDPRIGRWMSLDPLMAKFPHMSPYVGFDNNPILYTDPYGLSTNETGGEHGGSGDIGEDQKIEGDGEQWNYTFSPRSTSKFEFSVSNHDGGYGNTNTSSDKVSTYNNPVANLSTETNFASNSFNQPLTKTKLKDHYRQYYCNDCSEGQLERKTGLYFEELFDEYIEREFNAIKEYMIEKNFLKVDGGIRHTIPDYFGYRIESKSFFPPKPRAKLHAVYELKATKNNIGTSSFDEQLKVQVNFVKKSSAQELIVITTSDIRLTKSLRDYARRNKVILTHYEAIYTSFGPTMTISLRVVEYKSK